MNLLHKSLRVEEKAIQTSAAVPAWRGINTVGRRTYLAESRSGGLTPLPDSFTCATSMPNPTTSSQIPRATSCSSSQQRTVQTEIEDQSKQASMSGHEATHEAASNQTENIFFFTDPYGTQPHHVPVADNVSELDSSEDEVIFSGRQQKKPHNARPQAAPTNTTSTMITTAATAPVVVTVLDDDIQFLPQQTTTDKPAESEWKAILDPQDAQDSFISLSTTKRTRNRRKNKNKQHSTLNDENAIFADYVRNVTRQDRSSDPSSDDELPRFGLGLSSKDKDKFRALSTLDTVDESEVLASKDFAHDISDDDDDDDNSDDSDDSSSLEELLSRVRRGASFMMMDESWASSNDLSAEMLDDVDFDIVDMQQDGPLNKKKKKKGRKPIDFGLSDSDLELQLEDAWEKDRNKKKAKKREREQLRAEGLLGKKHKKSDRRSKDLAFGIDEMKVELKKFLQSHLDLPPMKKHHRRVVHELANALTLKSQSRGKGSARFPVLYKTARTPNFNGKHSVQLDKILAQPRFNQRQSGRMTSKPKFREQEPKNNNNRRRSNMAASYLEGEVVGASAPEIGANNKGRAMLEKMGWSTGTALGALNNKGILQPVAQVVKNTRAGLG
ncbi:hypothetical protein UA08_02108 [Talaromyces atroroseus]|uniref:Protein SQS1 n=1 Tax=Talaromyces atroroseus TaxID=1441469 RepID=A0A1Q5QAB1_TALAT|nr:hypothetical protein UA08_02108 [Talaromyces atroroseus]OKL62831.1 hypothetical protein UA08_02108 [Talaromyces atroroseus]